MKIIHIISCLCIIFLVASLANANMQELYIYNVVDGDSLLARTYNDVNSKKIKVRLWGIDSPEWNQHFSKESKAFMKKMVQGKIVKIESRGYDKYGRLLGIIYLDNNQTVNYLAVEEGQAWVHSYYCDEEICDEWLLAQDNAKRKKKGLWQNDNPIAPWIWKNKEKKYYNRDN